MREQWAWLVRFFAQCTDSKPLAAGATLQLLVLEAAERRSFFDTAIAEATKRFGQSKGEPHVLHPEHITWEWEVPTELIGAAVDFLAEGEPWTLHNARPASLVYCALFKLRDPVSRAVLQHQAARPTGSPRGFSRIIGAIGPHPWLYPHFAFPFTGVNKEFLAYLAAFTAELPFRLGPRHFRSVRPATARSREHIGFLSPEDDDKIRRAQRAILTRGGGKRGAA